MAGRALPPGELVRLDRIGSPDRAALVAHAERVGPIFKAVGWGELYVCVADLALGRQLLQAHGADLEACTLELGSLFPKGFLRQMEGEDHARYRGALVRAIRSLHLAEGRSRLENIAVDGLARYAANQSRDRSPETYRATLNAIATAMLIDIFFGVEVGTAAFERLWASYNALGPHGLVWNVGRAQRAVFVDIRDQLLTHLATPAAAPGAVDPRSIAGHMRRAGALDETALGNLIYMVEMGRYDLYLFFRWLSCYGAERPDALARIADEIAAPPTQGRSFAEAFVHEMLRMEQSERLTRRAKRDIHFAGYLIPRSTKVRVCLWEAHKSARAFPDPFRFDPERFLGRGPTREDFAPFGLDHHHCPLAEVSIRVSTVFLCALGGGYVVTPVGAGAASHGALVWEPARRFSVELQRRPRP